VNGFRRDGAGGGRNSDMESTMPVPGPGMLVLPSITTPLQVSTRRAPAPSPQSTPTRGSAASS
jgi:hypothetical protein